MYFVELLLYMIHEYVKYRYHVTQRVYFALFGGRQNLRLELQDLYQENQNEEFIKKKYNIKLQIIHAPLYIIKFL